MRLFALLLLLTSISVGYAQSTVATISARLKNKPLYLRGCWSSKDLHFNADGTLVGNSTPASFTLSGVRIKKIDIEQNRLMLKGNRTGLDLRNNQQKLVELNVPIEIEIDAPPVGDYGHALDAILATSIAELVPELPAYWKRYAVKNLLSNGEVSSPASRPIKRDSSIKPPRLIHSVHPKYPEWVYDMGYNGQTLINLWVSPDGTPSHFSIIQPVGMGLDEDALAAVMQYRFDPAIKDGKPVTVEVNVQVSLESH